MSEVPKKKKLSRGNPCSNGKCESSPTTNNQQQEHIITTKKFKKPDSLNYNTKMVKKHQIHQVKQQQNGLKTQIIKSLSYQQKKAAPVQQQQIR